MINVASMVKLKPGVTSYPQLKPNRKYLVRGTTPDSPVMRLAGVLGTFRKDKFNEVVHRG